jgi:hypothetical protein
MVAVIVITFLTAYIGLLLWFISKHYMRFWVPVVQPGPTGSQRGRYPWARAVRILLSITHFFAFVGVIWWFPFSLAMLLSSTGDPDWGAATSIPSGFTLNLAELPGVEATGFFNQTINGTMTMTVDVLTGVQWFIFSLGTEIKAILGVFVLLQLRNIFAELANGTPFKAANEKRLRRVGIVLLVAYAVEPFWQFFAWGAVIGSIDVIEEVFSLQAPFNLNGSALLLGLGLIAFSGAMREAEKLQAEQRLTI